MIVDRRSFAPNAFVLTGVRRWVREVLSTWRVTSTVIDDVVLLVSELATNAVQHAGTVFEVALTLPPGRVRASVADDNPSLPQPRSPRPSAVSGRGLKMVRSLSVGWGAEPVSGDGKVVWFEVTS